MTVQTLYTEQAVLDTLKCLKAQGKTLREISTDDYPGTTYGDISRALRGIFPKSAHKRQAFNLPALAPAPVCPSHGVVHLRKTCPRPRRYRDLWDIPTAELRRMVEDRQ